MDYNEQQKPAGWERELVEELALSSLKEKRRTRRWGIFFKLLTFTYLFIFVWLMVDRDNQDNSGRRMEHTALVNVSGVIMDGAEASADNIITGLREAFKNEYAKGVIIRINSPGGSPVQAGYINDEIRRLKQEYPDTKVYAVVMDVCASGGYYIAAAADEIYVDKASIVGSIGVLMNGFGMVEGMQKLGIERRLMTAGEHKAIMDPFSPVKESERMYMQGMLDNIHQQFISVVKEGRGDRLKGDSNLLFSGLFWTGEESIKLGLADGLGSSSYVAREMIKAEKIVDYTPSRDWLERFSKQVGGSAGAALGQILGLTSFPTVR
jgi:protease-4